MTTPIDTKGVTDGWQACKLLMEHVDTAVKTLSPGVSVIFPVHSSLFENNEPNWDILEELQMYIRCRNIPRGYCATIKCTDLDDPGTWYVEVIRALN